MLDFVIDFFFPTGSGKLTNRVAESLAGDTLAVESWRPGAIKRALNDSGWLGEDVVAAGQLRQGKTPSLIAMITGWALIELLRPRRSKSLPRQFVLAVTADRVVAFKASGGGDSESNYELRITPGECGSWPRGSVWISGGLLELEGVERIPVARSNMDRDPSTDELFEALSN